ncbi:glycerophosphoryl diester phosphodiesterase membrane domain-containing protein [Streptomyces sp. NPDC089919]|uniref:glycerophosphoryl diester phosphodiesterase membrane domain-containing protein n=1 Tax=Streptomyces sp. NPDC089919 TaxID=3155188 RepID=UPI00342A84D4
MNDSPGWASPGSTPADGERPETPAPAPEPKWSAEQPPPGQWSALTPGADPTATPGGGPAQGPGQGPAGPAGGPGGPNGWGGGQNGWGGGAHTAWGAKPYAPKPGVIPLRPLSVGEILDGAVSTMRAHWRTVLSITLAVAVVTELAITLVQGLALDDLDAGSTGPDASLSDVVDSLSSSLAGSAIAQVITLIGTILATAMLTMVFSRAVLGKSTTVAAAWQESRPRLLRLTGLTLLLTLLTAGILTVGVLPGALTGSWPLIALGFLVALPVAIWLYIRFSLASPALMLEKQTIRTALTRSARLVKGAWWRIFLITVLTAIITAIVTGIIVFPFTLMGMVFSGEGSAILNGTAELGWGFLIVSGIGAVVALTITMPISAGVTVMLYIDQRIRREALDLELTRAAGLAGTEA